jgi:glycosyltransferase involved in cell wall biosynthesis
MSSGDKVIRIAANERNVNSSSLRLACIGSPSEGGGVGGFCLQLLKGLSRQSVDVTVFSICDNSTFAIFFQDDIKPPRHVPVTLNWSWDRWYSRNHLSVFLSSFYARRKAYSKILLAIQAEHQRQPFDVILQFSQSEIFEAERMLATLPPFVIFPCVHAAGELYWHRKESALARRSESRLKHFAVRWVLSRRARVQSSTYRKVYGVIGMSRRFNELVRLDYGVDPKDQAVVYQPLPSVAGANGDTIPVTRDKVRAVFVGRISVRKGIEMLVNLSRRITDLRDVVEIAIVGDRSFWSDYSALLRDFDPTFVQVKGALSHSEVLELLRNSDILLVPSHYEPGGIVVAEGLASGCLIVASDEVGSAEVLDAPLCLRYPHADIDAFENAFRLAVKAIRDRGPEIRRMAKEAALQVFSPNQTNAQLMRVLLNAANGRGIGDDADAATDRI